MTHLPRSTSTYGRADTSLLQAIGVKAVRVGEYGASNDAIAAGEADMFLQAWQTTPQGDSGAVLEAC